MLLRNLLLVFCVSLWFPGTTGRKSQIICKTVRCRPRSLQRRVCRYPRSKGITSILLMREYSKSLCEEEVTYGADKRGGLWTERGCDARFQICFTTRKAICFDDSECGTNAECSEGNCRCKHGYFGNPFVSCDDLCVCSAYGDPHYRQFDKKYYTFNGFCKYTWTKYTDPKGQCSFNVEVKNERRGKRRRISYTRLIDVHIYGLTIRLSKKKKVFIDGLTYFMPVSLPHKNITIYNTGEYGRFVTGCGLSILWNGKSEAIVMVSRRYGKKLTGLCGNCNGVDDDLVTKDGTDVTGKNNYAVLIGESFEVRDDTGFETEECETSAIDDPCTGIMDQYVQKMDYCGMLKLSNQARSPFRECIEDHEDLANTLYTSCRYDVCAYFHDVHRRKEIMCESLNSLAAECESRGVVVRWRKENFCPMSCPKHMRYSSRVSGCPATCIDLHPNPATCTFPPTEGCECVPGYVHSGESCVPLSECGCKTEIGYMPIGKSMMTLNCAYLLKCEYKNGKGYLSKSPVHLICHKYASCGLRNGYPSCACKIGYFGDGVKNCHALCNGKKCCDYAHCENNHCVCDHGYHGNAYLECEPQGVCDGKKCNRRAVCVNYNCVCKPGYIGDGYNSCLKLCGGHRCVAHAYCDGKQHCRCKKGFHGDGYTHCERQQTCGGNPCAKNAYCVNYQCTCKAGYYGHGITKCIALCGGKRCVDHAYCSNDRCICQKGYHGDGYFICEVDGICNGVTCAENAHCLNQKCQCKPGYYGQPYTACRPLCSGKKCTVNAVCVNGQCKCNYGYHGDGLVKCETPGVCNGKHCAPHAVCVNYQCLCKTGFCGDGYVKCDALCNGRKCVENAYCYKDTCRCNDGFHGNGYIKCETKDVCRGRQCAPNAKCVNYHCVCKDGYVGSGYTECEELCSNRKCAKYAVCVNGQCQCRDGFHGNPMTSCTPIVYCDGRKCALNAKCNNFHCVCDDGYYGDGYVQCTALCNNVKCCNNAECQNGQCVCKEGYHGNGAKKCEVLSLCGGKTCSTNAACIDYQCQCLPGYLGNGYHTCKKLCNGQICTRNAYCSHNNQCLCKANFHGDGTKLCEALSICGGKSCVANSHCFNYKCVCDTGFVGCGYTKCEKLCQNKKCGSYAFCDANECICQNGYHGNPYIKCESENVCDGKVCAPYAVCNDYKCFCRQGYSGDGYRSCTKLCNGHVCVKNAICSREGNCVCGPGYHGNGLKKCEVLSVCGGKVCHQFAVCDNYHCKCRFGYYGDGSYTCTAYCGGKQCVKHSSCLGETCVCDAGYHGNGAVKCEDQGTCGGKVCCKNSKCMNYYCVCKEGYYGNGYDICLPYCNNRKCVANANCINGKCVCRQGYHGDGYYKCELLGICNGQRCAEHSECYNYKCQCRNGYYGDGYCQCQALCGGSHCKPFSVCRNETCDCIHGYHGNGFTLCEPLTQCGGRTCHFNAECINYKCHCKYGFTGDGYHNCVALCGRHRCVKHSTCVRHRCECVTGYHGYGTYKCEADGICGGKICAYNARCNNFRCVCMNGYAGDGYHKCYELCNGQKCNDNAFCHRRQCRCNPGYHGDGLHRCEDDRYCDGKTCAPNADCINFVCQCKEGYHGNGYTYCEPLCSGKICTKYALCVDGCCTCQEGYHGNAFKYCELKKFCGNKTCAENAECNNYICQCKAGFYGNGYKKCDALCNGRKCVKNSICVHNKCVCKEGHHGDGYYRCEADGYCDGLVCSRHAQCYNFLCRCHKGYYGDGYKRCDPYCGRKLCVEHAHCVQDRCMCHTGYHGNPVIKCEPLEYCGGQRCHMNAICENYNCKCRKGYHGDGYNFCDPKGYCKGVKCADNTECVDGQCVCKGGYVGNGHHRCDRTCMCSAFGDAYIKTYDGQLIYHNGECTYTLTKSTRFPDPCAFNVEVLMKSYTSTTSCIKAVAIEMWNLRVQLGPGYKVFVNGYLHYLPLDLHGEDMDLQFSGNWLLLTTKCGLRVWWNGDASVKVQTLNSCSGHMTGLCGNCNGQYEDDYITRDGSDVSGYPPNKRDLEIIKSYIVTPKGEPFNMQCMGNLKQCVSCTHRQEIHVAERRFCGHLNFNHEGSPFRRCMNMYPNLAKMLYDACRRDVCLHHKNRKIVRHLTCGYVELMAIECLHRGVTVRNFRQHCPLYCMDNAVYSIGVSACPATCMNKHPVCEGLPFSEGCTCNAGYFRSGDICVPATECGCYCPDRHYIPLYSSYTTEDCSETLQCKIANNRPEFRHTSIGVKCHTKAVCGLTEGIPTCVCVDGYVGDGYKNCTKKVLPAIPRHLIGHPVNNKFFSKVFYG